MIELGIKGAQSVEVVDGNTAAAMGSGDLPVFATPAMVALIEKTASESLIPYLEMGTSTVGTHLDIAHSSATPIGMTIVCETELIEIDRRRLVFKVKVYDSKSEVGSGTHERFVVDSMKFMEKAQLKKS
ncbi:MAG: thioesterase family protein [Candidatus Methanomethylophilaceae archaeon]|nr:thioesterase family protein [Candidatus Methanomethylophilaceae archaeon]